MGLMVLHSIVLTSGLYGWEVWGVAISESSAVQSVLNMGLRFILLGKALNATSVSVMQLEMDMFLVYVYVIGKRLRSMWKGRKLSRTLCDLMGSMDDWKSNKL